MSSYRREIDGLRAFAVLSVVLFHAGLQNFSGGFVGLDVFFVISGYLITSIILKERQADTFTLVGFYERRARRILPALFVVMFASLLPAWNLLLPSDMKEYSRSMVAVPTFLSNVFFLITSEYFDEANELKPFLHTWSLAVEEQYYVLFPLFLLLVWKYGRRPIVAIFTALAIASLLTAHWGAIAYPAATFFLLPTRGWELLIGAIAAIILLPKLTDRLAYITNQTGSFLGLLLITYAVCTFDRNTPVPSFYTLIPTLGAALVIVFATPRTLVGRLLGSTPAVGIGLISYSLYLWHQPLFAFARHGSIDRPSTLLFLILGMTAVALAYLTWRYVETPFRNRQCVHRDQIVWWGILASLSFICFGLIGSFSQGYRGRIPPEVLGYVMPEKTDTSNCAPERSHDNQDVHVCFFGDTTAKTIYALYGDSHATALYSALDLAFKAKNLKGALVYTEACEAIPGLVLERTINRMLKELHGCKTAFEQLLAHIDGHISGVIVSIRWTYWLYPIAGLIDEQAYDNGEGGVEFMRPDKFMALRDDGNFTYGAEEKRRAVLDMLSGFNSLNKPVVVVSPVPEVGWDIPRLNHNRYLRSELLLEETVTTSYQRFKQRQAFINSILDNIKDSGNIIAVKPESVLCDTYVKDRCVAQLNGIPLYYDDDHLSNAGARLVVNEILRRIGEPLRAQSWRETPLSPRTIAQN